MILTYKYEYYRVLGSGSGSGDGMVYGFLVGDGNVCEDPPKKYFPKAIPVSSAPAPIRRIRVLVNRSWLNKKKIIIPTIILNIPTMSSIS